MSADRKQNRTDNGTDRLQEIRARLDAATFPHWRNYREFDGPRPRVVFERWPAPKAWNAGYDNPIDTEAQATLCRHAPADIAWLLGRLDFETRLVADLEDQLDRAHERYAAEIELLRNTKVSVSQPLCDGVDVEPMRTENGTELLRDDSVVQGVTKRECGPNTLDEIRAVIDAGGPVFTVDARYLLEQVDELTKRVRMYEVVKS